MLNNVTLCLSVCLQLVVVLVPPLRLAVQPVCGSPSVGSGSSSHSTNTTTPTPTAAAAAVAYSSTHFLQRATTYTCTYVRSNFSLFLQKKKKRSFFTSYKKTTWGILFSDDSVRKLFFFGHLLVFSLSYRSSPQNIGG